MIVCVSRVVTNIMRVMISSRVRWVGHVVHMGEPEESKPLGRTRSRWDEHTKIFLKYDGSRPINLA